MKPPRTPLLLALVLAGGTAAFAQTNTVATGPVDYSTYSRLVADRNIFDPNRQPHTPATRTVRKTTHTRTPSAAPAFSLVGTMSYEKGWFAFFNGNQDELKRALSADQTIAGYTVTKITYGRVLLATTNQTDSLQLKVGDVMRQEGGKWLLAESRDLPTGSSNASATDSSGAGSSESSAGTPAASSASEPNEILKRLMQKREQENK